MFDGVVGFMCVGFVGGVFEGLVGMYDFIIFIIFIIICGLVVFMVIVLVFLWFCERNIDDFGLLLF